MVGDRWDLRGWAQVRRSESRGGHERCVKLQGKASMSSMTMCTAKMALRWRREQGSTWCHGRHGRRGGQGADFSVAGRRVRTGGPGTERRSGPRTRLGTEIRKRKLQGPRRGFSRYKALGLGYCHARHLRGSRCGTVQARAGDANGRLPSDRRDEPKGRCPGRRVHT